jgi:DNA-binding NarL/FixJ family response regulator
MIRVALMDDHPLILKILQQDLAKEHDIEVIWHHHDISQLFTLLTDKTPDVLVLDLSFSGQGFEPVTAVRDLGARFPKLAILILTAFDDPIWIEELLQAGAVGYVVKSDDFSLRLADAIRTVAKGRRFLSATAVIRLTEAHQKHTLSTRERAVLRLAAEGKTNGEIADILDIAHGTVRNHISNIYAKLGVDNRESAIKSAQHLRELPSPGATLRHELRTPLHTLLGLARLLQSRVDRKNQLERADCDEFLRQIILEAERMDGLINDLL